MPINAEWIERVERERAERAHMDALAECVAWESELAPREGWTLSTCFRCGGVSREEMFARFNGEYFYFCEDCLGDETECSECGRSDVFAGVEVIYHEDHDAYYCQNCFPAEPRIHDYGYKPRALFHSDTGGISYQPGRGTAYFGIELETECGSRVSSQEIADAWKEFSHDENYFYCKHDSSLMDGIEVVSHPRTLDSWRDYCADEFAAVLYFMARKGVKAWNADTCGLHVHVSADTFASRSHLARFALLINRNRNEAQRFASRQSSYANFDPLGQTIKKVKRESYPGHFDAVNLGGNEETTIEIRIFRPSLAVARVLGSIEFVAGAVEYTRTMTGNDVMQGALRFPRFSKYLIDEGYSCAALINEGVRFAVAPTLQESISNIAPRATREDVVSCA